MKTARAARYPIDEPFEPDCILRKQKENENQRKGKH